MLKQKIKISNLSQISRRPEGDTTDREGYRECIAILKLLLNLDKKYKRMRLLAIDDPPSFYREVGLLARELHNLRKRFKEFMTRYGEYVNLKADYKTGKLKIEYTGKSRRLTMNNPVMINPNLLKELDMPSLDIRDANEVLHEETSSIASEEIELLRPKEAAKLLKVSYKTLWRWWKEGEIKAIQIGPSKRLRYYKSDLEKFIIKGKA